MTFLSAYDDFVRGTLAALPTAIGRLRYLAELRTASAYEHWGMRRVYGAETAQQAMSRAHTAVVLEILRLPIREVMRQVRQEAAREAVGAPDYVLRLLDKDAALRPEKLGGGSARHFTATLSTLSRLARKSAGANLPAA